MFGLYIHLPICRHICNYCDFFKMVVSNNYQDKVINAICNEIDKTQINTHIDTVYLGGGTPSALTNDNLERVLKSVNKLLLRTNCQIDVMEYTIEMNPEDINEELIMILKKYPINRISIGIQSFNFEVLNILGRSHDYHDILNKIEILKKNGYTNINIDYIYSVLPSDLYDLENQKKDIEMLLNLNPTHLSCYSLIVEDKTILGKKSMKRLFERPSEEDDLNQYLNLQTILSENGFKQYEISNYAISKKYQSLHNKIYWHNENYLGLGPSASGYVCKNDLKIRYTNAYKISDYEQGVLLEEEQLTKQDEMVYEIILGLRLVEGINEKTFYEKYHQNIVDVFPKIIDFINDGVIDRKDGYLFVKQKHLYILDHILREII